MKEQVGDGKRHELDVPHLAKPMIANPKMVSLHANSSFPVRIVVELLTVSSAEIAAMVLW